MPPQSFFVARGRKRLTKKKTKILNRKFSDICRKEVDNIWTVSRYCDDTGKSDEQIVKVKNKKLKFSSY
jgi:hypothetical protein